LDTEEHIMTGTWRLTPRLEDFVAGLVKEAGIGATDTPSLMWSQGGTIEASDQPPRPLPPHYALGWVRKQDLHKFKTIPSSRFGAFVFHPRPEDAASSRRLIDLDEDEIVVR
jgi:hypothetical protein